MVVVLLETVLPKCSHVSGTYMQISCNGRIASVFTGSVNKLIIIQKLQNTPYFRCLRKVDFERLIKIQQ